MSATARRSARKAAESEGAGLERHGAVASLGDAQTSSIQALAIVESLEVEFSKAVEQALGSVGPASRSDAVVEAELLSELLNGLQKSVFAEVRRRCDVSSESGGAAAEDVFEHPAVRGNEGHGLLAEEAAAAATLGSPLPPVDASLARRVGEAEREHARLAAEVKAARKKGGEVLAAHASIYDARLSRAVAAAAPVLRAHERSLTAGAAVSSEISSAGAGAGAAAAAAGGAGRGGAADGKRRAMVPASSKGRALAAALDASEAAAADAAAASAATSSSGAGAGAGAAPRRRSRGSFGAAMTSAAATAARIEPAVLALVVGSRRTRSQTALSAGHAAPAEHESAAAALPGDAAAAALDDAAKSARRAILDSAAAAAPVLAASISQQRQKIAKIKKNVTQTHAVAHMEMERGPATAAFDAVVAKAP